jgi:hypothetical protein
MLFRTKPDITRVPPYGAFTCIYKERRDLKDQSIGLTSIQGAFIGIAYHEKTLGYCITDGTRVSCTRHQIALRQVGAERLCTRQDSKAAECRGPTAKCARSANILRWQDKEVQARRRSTRTKHARELKTSLVAESTQHFTHATPARADAEDAQRNSCTGGRLQMLRGKFMQSVRARIQQCVGHPSGVLCGIVTRQTKSGSV